MTSSENSPAITKVMKAWQFTNASAGLDKSLTINDSVPTPTPGKDQVLVQVTAASVNPIDYKLAEIPILGRFIYGSPATPGMDFAGRVVQSNIPDFQPGEKVFGTLDGPGKYGSLGQFVVAGNEIAKLPEGVDDDSAAALGATASTAYQYLVRGQVKNGSKIFINGGSGGVGPWAIQMAKIMGAEVTTSCSTRNEDLCKSLGADEVIDYTKEDLIAKLKSKGHYFDLVVDNIGKPDSLYVAADGFLKPKCQYIQIGAGMSVGAFYSLMSRQLCPSFLGNGSRPFVFMSGVRKRQDLEQLGQWLAEKKMRAVFDSKIIWNEAPKAYAILKAGHAQGKIIVNAYPDSN